MNDTEIISQFIKVEPGDAELNISVCHISWPHPHEPQSDWSIAATMPTTSSAEEIDGQILAILEDKRYFQVCQDCQQRKLRGWMHDNQICQGCAELNYGIIY
ncbi:hypothetical protein VB712_17550 [Spirulina sp. CCNP1310]|uniref:hypothetical protein n=1 Tax=Spirulina sp. CCNP1310 TaxID=3110249 RepID=UPI002B210863|nr:hypothetical protein [Spirulina sp. CCNP1310]MEA5421034.1 hypothetical protein [Spirulina sp. CCNP1310]